MIKLTRLFVGGTLKGLTYTNTLTYSAAEYAEYVGMMKSGRILGGGSFGSEYRFVSVEIV